MKNDKTDLALLLVRLALGAVFVAHGLNKFFPAQFGGGEGIPGVQKFLTTLQVPQPELMAYIVAGIEAGGGLLVALGLFTRIAALGLFGIMVVAFAKVHMRNGFFMETHGFEYVLVLGLCALALVTAGGGKLGLEDVVMKKKNGGKK